MSAHKCWHGEPSLPGYLGLIMVRVELLGRILHFLFIVAQNIHNLLVF